MKTATVISKPEKKHLIAFTIKFDADTLINDIVQNFPEYAQYCFQITDWKYSTCTFKFTDTETGKKYTATLPKFRKGLQMMLSEFEKEKLPGLSVNLGNFRDAGTWDAYDLDALLQFTLLGKCIYG